MELTSSHSEAMPAWSLGDSRQFELVVGDAEVRAFADLTGDVNPLHLSAEYARGRGYSRPVAHGLLALGAISRLIGTELPGPGALWISQTAQFAQPVFVGDALTAVVTVEQLSTSTGVVALRTEVFRARTRETVLLGTAQVQMPKDKAMASPTAAAVTRPRDIARTEAPRQLQREIAASTRVALVTGSSRGLGRAIAEGLGARGIAVIVHYHEREAEANDTVSVIRDAGGQAAACRADLDEPDSARRLFADAEAVFGRVDVLINGATPPIVSKPVLDCEWTDFDRYLRVYLRSGFELAQCAASGMRARGFGRIVNVLTSYAFGAPPAKLAPYVAAKSALAGLSRSMAVELGPYGITVNMVAPSMVITDQTTSISERHRQLAAAQTPLRRLASSRDVADAVGFLVSDAAGFVTGAVLPVTGGGAIW